MMPCFKLLTLLGCLFSFSLTAAPWEHRDLSNGLQVFVKEDHRASVVLVHVWYRVGSVDEPAGITGISHLLEHMMFQGTTKHPAGEYARLVTERGGQYNAFTTQDYTGFFAFVSAEYLPLILDLESDRMVNLTFDQTLFENEKKVVMEERRMRVEDQPAALFVEQFDLKAYGDGPYAHPVIGWAQDIAHYQLKDYQTWYQKWYSPQNAIVMIAGDVQTKQVFEWVEAKFGSLPNKNPVPNSVNRSSRKAGKVSFEAPFKTSVEMLMMGYSVPVLQSAQEQYVPYALLLLRDYLAGSDDGLLVRRLVREKKLAVEINTSYEVSMRLDTQFVLGAIPAPGVSLDTLQQNITSILEGLKEQLISEEELKRLKTQCKAQFIYQQDSLSHQVEWLGSLLLSHQSPGLTEKFLGNIEAITAEQIQAVARAYFLEPNLTQGRLIPDTKVTIQPAKEERAQ